MSAPANGTVQMCGVSTSSCAMAVTGSKSPANASSLPALGNGQPSVGPCRKVSSCRCPPPSTTGCVVSHDPTPARGVGQRVAETALVHQPLAGKDEERRPPGGWLQTGKLMETPLIHSGWEALLCL